MQEGADEGNMKKSVKVLQVLDFINHNSGVSSVVMNYYLHMDKTTVECDFLLYEPAADDLAGQIKEHGSKIYVTGQPGGRKIAAYRRRVGQFFSEHMGEYDIIHMHIPNAAFIVLRAAKKYGVPVRIIHAHNARGADGIWKKMRNLVLNKWGICYANQFMACSKAAGVYLFGEKMCSQGRVPILNNAIDLKKYHFNLETRHRCREELGIREDEVLFGHIGRFCEQKNHKGLIDIFEALCKRGVKGKLLLLGEGELKGETENLVAERGLSGRVIFQGTVTNVEDYMSAMDIFLLPSLYEGLPVVCVEAQAMGLPCVVSENITKEIAQMDRIAFAANEGLQEWCGLTEKLLSDPADRDMVRCPDVYDIVKQAKELEEIYLQYEKSSNTDVNL